MKPNNRKLKKEQLIKELKFLYRVAQNVHSLDLDKLLKEIVNIAVEVSHGDSCLVYVLDAKKDELVLKASKNPHPDLVEKIKMKLGEGITGWVAREKKPVAISQNASQDPRFKFFRNLPEDRFEAFLSVPIMSKHVVLGVINIQHQRKHVYSQMEEDLLSAIGKLVGGAVENALLVEETLVLKESLEIRKIVEKAKGILMKSRNITEEEAYRALRKKSMQSRRSLKEIAEAVILADKIGA